MATNRKRGGLGRGLEALIPSGPKPDDAIDVFFDGGAPAGRNHVEGDADKGTLTSAVVDEPSDTADETAGAPDLVAVRGAAFAELDTDRIVPNARQPRQEFDPEELEELTVSIREFGVLQPIVVRPIPDGHPDGAFADYELIMGERRLRAAKAAELATIPAIVKSTDDDAMLRDALLENLHRAQLNPLEEASAYRQLLEDFGITQAQLSERIGRSRPRIANTLRLLRLPVSVQRQVAAGVLSAGHARAILSVDDPEQMLALAEKIIHEELSVRDAESAAARLNRPATRTTTEERQGRRNDTGVSAYLKEVGDQLGDRLNTRVEVNLGRRKGQIRIDFASVRDLQRILDDLGTRVAEEAR